MVVDGDAASTPGTSTLPSNSGVNAEVLLDDDEDTEARETPVPEKAIYAGGGGAT